MPPKKQLKTKVKSESSTELEDSSSNEEITELNHKVDNIKPHMDDSWLKAYMIEDDEEKNKYLTELNIVSSKTDDLIKLKERLTQAEVDIKNRNN